MPGPKMREIKIKSYAKINLALDVIGLRDDGYDSDAENRAFGRNQH